MHFPLAFHFNSLISSTYSICLIKAKILPFVGDIPLCHTLLLRHGDWIFM